MSKVVKRVGGAVNKVVKGAAKVVKKVAKSPIGKALLIAGAVYFTGGAALGALGGAAGGGGMAGALAGAGQGIASAWGGLTGAAGAIVGGQGLSAAGSSLAGGWGMGAGAVAGSSVAKGAGLIGGMFGGGAPVTAQNAMYSPNFEALTGVSTAGGVAPGAATAAAGGAASGGGGLLAGAWNGLGPYGKAALVNTAGSMIGGAASARSARQEEDRSRSFLNANMSGAYEPYADTSNIHGPQGYRTSSEEYLARMRAANRGYTG